MRGRTQSERRAETRTRLLAAAAELFAERGVDAVSVDAVAGAAGRTSGAVYDHFGSKQGLVVALLDGWKHTLVAVIQAEFALSSTLEERLRAVAANLVVHPTDDTRRGRRLEQELWRRARHDPAIAEVLRARAREAEAWMARGFAAWIDQGLIPPAPPATLALAFRCAVEGLTIQHDLDPDRLDVDTAAAALAAVVGVAARPDPSRPDPSRVDRSRVDRNRADRSRADRSRADRSRAGVPDPPSTGHPAPAG